VGVDGEEVEEEEEGMSLMRRRSSVIMEPDFGSFFTTHLTFSGGEDGDEGEEVGSSRSVGASRTEDRAWSTKGFCMRPVPEGLVSTIPW
jgi:hypothetical protein